MQHYLKMIYDIKELKYLAWHGN